MITVLTATYNRSHTLPTLYESLLNQTNKNLEWLVIDDGSTDRTEQLIRKFTEDDLIDIRYLKKNNGGKHSALNLGFNEAKHEWILIVDSDDWLKNDAIDFMINESSKLDISYNSLSTLRVYEDNSVIGTPHIESRESYIDFTKRKVTGDKADLIRKSALKGFSFPEFESENFMAEGPMFLWLGSKGKTKFVNYGGYVCKYLPEGLSDNSIVNRHRCFNSTLFVYESIYKTYPLSSTDKHRAAINWWRFKLFKDYQNEDFKAPTPYAPLGLVMYTKDQILSIFNKQKLIKKLNK
jgi:glycosyltransferase involved in cell wall biosynthesis